MNSIQTKIPFDRQIEEIMDEFDFDNVHKVMDFLKWTWDSADEGVPRVAELRKTARKLLEQVAESKSTYNATGGFYARLDKWGLLSLDFAVSNWDVEDPVLQG